MIFKKLLGGVATQRHEARRAELYRNLIRREAKLGGELFGPVPKGGRREFFCLDEHTWVWHEEWIDANGKRQLKTTRYDVRPNGILKAQDGTVYSRITDDEARHLYQATQEYARRVQSELYSFV